jgi:hypothetical protein
MPTAEEKQRLALESEWPVDIAAEYFDIAEEDARGHAGAEGSDTLNRFALEKKLAYEQLVGLDWLALEFGVSRDSLQQAMCAPPAGHAPFPLDIYAKGGRFLLPRGFSTAWVKDLLPKHRVWSSLDARARDLAEAAGLTLRECAVSLQFHELPPSVATCRCIVTWDDVSRAHQEYIANGKPLPLEPDHAGWHAIQDGRIDRAQLFRTELTNMEAYVADRRVA